MKNVSVLICNTELTMFHWRSREKERSIRIHRYQICFSCARNNTMEVDVSNVNCLFRLCEHINDLERLQKRFRFFYRFDAPFTLCKETYFQYIKSVQLRS